MTRPAHDGHSFLSQSSEQTRRAGAVIGERLRSGDVIALCGPLGAGKTELVKGIAAGLDVPADQRVSSPTFVLVREYAGRLTLFHIDAYRLSGASELSELGFDEFCELPHAAVAIEWADRVPKALPAGVIRIELGHAGENRRSMCISTAVENPVVAEICREMAGFMTRQVAEDHESGG